MLFTETRFLFLFLPIVFLLYYLSPKAAKNSILLLASILFYGFGEGYYTLVIAFSIVFNYFLGHIIDQQEEIQKRRGMLTLAIAANLMVLISFKYTPFIVENINAVLGLLKVHKLRTPHLHLPLGISFFTFHAISYITDVYRREVKPMKRFDSFALYVTLFPQLVAGPIIRYKTICDQFELGGPSGRKHTWEDFAYGIRRFTIGLGKKMLIANILAVTADGVFATPGARVTPGAAWLGIICYTFQIYFDFSGYSDMAIGLGHMFGFRFPENFNYPYVATSVTDFWRRWHMSLSTWFRDYVYIPLGGNRVSPERTYLNLLTVFFLCGFWHGPTWNFIFWGLYFGGFLIVERLGFGKWLAQQMRPLQHLYLLVVVVIGWVFFRAETLNYAWKFIARMFGSAPAYGGVYIEAGVFIDRQMLLALAAACICSVPWLPMFQKRWLAWSAGHRGAASEFGAVGVRTLELAALSILFIVSICFAANATYSPFIYFRF